MGEVLHAEPRGEPDPETWRRLKARWDAAEAGEPPPDDERTEDEDDG